MPPAARHFTAGLVLAGGGSRRLGRPKQLLPFGDTTLLGAVVDTTRGCGFDQLVVALGGSASEVRSRVDLDGCEVVENDDYGEGCSSSIAAGVTALDPRWETLVLLLGDQPGVGPATVRALLRGRGQSHVAVCRYDDGRGHPFAFRRAVFPELEALHGDKAVWKLLERWGAAVAEVRVGGAVPGDVDTWEDYETMVGAR